MEVVNNNRKLKVYWMYNDSVFGLMLERLQAEQEKIDTINRLPLKKQVEMWNLMFPESQAEATGTTCDTTWCFVTEDGKTIGEASVIRYYKDPNDRDKARKYALQKVLKKLVPDSKEERSKFWEAYLQRQSQPVIPMAVVK
jgi:hypothetical protein